MTTAYTILFALCLLGLGAFALAVMLDHHRKRRGVGLPEDVWRNAVAGPALGNSLWTGPQPMDVDPRRLDGPDGGSGTAPREGWARAR
jgi:hypothetical protein